MGNEASTDSSNSESDNEEQEQKETFYHYTDEKGAEGINEDKMIYASNGENGDAVFGTGRVYLTAMDPDTHSKEEILSNIFDDGPNVHELPQFEDKADRVIAVDIPVNEVSKVEDTDRDIYVYEGNLDLEEYEHSEKKVE